MNTGYTQVNYEQLNSLTDAMRNAEERCSNALNIFSSSMQQLAESGQIEGAAIVSLKSNMYKINKLEENFEDYCEEVIKEINNIVAEEKEIETSFEQQYDELLSINPEDYKG